MYQKFDNPWHQNEEIFHSHSRWDTILTLKQYNISSFLEVGCSSEKIVCYAILM